MNRLKLCFLPGTEKEFTTLGSRKVMDRFSIDMEMIMDGLQPLSSKKALNGLGKGVFELKKNGRPAYRCVCVVKDGSLYILHAFSKTADGTQKEHETTIKKRYKLIP